MKNIVLVVLLVCIGAYGCAGRTPNPVQTYQYGDEKRSCAGIRSELSNIDAEIQRKLPDSDKTGSNVALGVAGAIFLVPWFFMDFSKADQVEIEALRRRHNSLVIIAADKSCGFDDKPIPEFKPPADNAETKS